MIDPALTSALTMLGHGACAALGHVARNFIDQKRPDRRTATGEVMACLILGGIIDLSLRQAPGFTAQVEFRVLVAGTLGFAYGPLALLLAARRLGRHVDPDLPAPPGLSVPPGGPKEPHDPTH